MKHNAHVYKYFRWKAFVATKRGNSCRAFFMNDFARQEAGLTVKQYWGA